MLRHRCPWCGEMLPLFDLRRYGVWHFKTYCPACERAYQVYTLKRKKDRIIGWLLLTGVILSQFIFPTHVRRHLGKYSILAVFVTLMLVLIVIATNHTPYERDIKKKERKNTPPKKKVRAAIEWTDHKEKGFLLPRLSMANGEILPACFLSPDGVPISTALCVTLEELHWTDSHHCDGQVSLVRDDATADQLLREENSFYLYHNYQQVAEGRVSGNA